MKKSEALKDAFKLFCASQQLRASRDYEVGCARLIVRKGLYILETTCVSESMSKYAPGTVGFNYPAGVRGLTDSQMVQWLRDNA